MAGLSLLVGGFSMAFNAPAVGDEISADRRPDARHDIASGARVFVIGRHAMHTIYCVLWMQHVKREYPLLRGFSMFNSTIIDVVAGLLFAFLAVSLAASSI